MLLACPAPCGGVVEVAVAEDPGEAGLGRDSPAFGATITRPLAAGVAPPPANTAALDDDGAFAPGTAYAADDSDVETPTALLEPQPMAGGEAEREATR